MLRFRVINTDTSAYRYGIRLHTTRKLLPANCTLYCNLVPNISVSGLQIQIESDNYDDKFRKQSLWGDHVTAQMPFCS